MLPIFCEAPDKMKETTQTRGLLINPVENGVAANKITCDRGDAKPVNSAIDLTS